MVSVEVQTETGSDVIDETTPPALYAREGAVGDDDSQACLMLHLLHGAVEITSPQVHGNIRTVNISYVKFLESGYQIQHFYKQHSVCVCE